MSKSKFKIHDKVKDQDGNISIITNIYERNEASNIIILEYQDGFSGMDYECFLERIDNNE